MGSSQHAHQELKITPFQAPQSLKSAAYAFVFLGVITFALGLFKNPDRLWTSYLTAFFYFACLASGAMFFIAFNHAAKAGWSASIRRLAEGMTSFFPVMFVTGLFLIFGFKYLYAWAVPETFYNLTGGKQIYLNQSFVIGRLFFFCFGMWMFARYIVGNSIKQDQSGSHDLTHKNLKASIAFIAFFAIFYTMFSIDLMMSLLPTWYSTIYGVYCFAGALQSAMAALAIIIVWMRHSPWLSGYVTEEHQHDVGKFLKGFTVFWAYIAFSQFMLIWYANIPEETEFYIMRSLNGWIFYSFALLIFRFAVPFLVLLPRGSKRNDTILVAVSALVLVMQYVDLYWLVYPNFNEGEPRFGFWEVGMFLGFAGLFLMALIRFFSKNSLVAVKDPRLHEALKHHVTY